MPKQEYRLDLWRKAISLFYERTKPSVVGPFKQAGYAGLGPQGLKIGPKLLDDQHKEKTPDIVSARPGHWVAVELTADLNAPKKYALESYAKLDGSYLASYGLHTPGKPNALLARQSQPASHVDDGNFAIMILGGTFDGKNFDQVNDPELRKALEAYVGTVLDDTPELKFTLLPEQKPQEIRRAIAASVLTIFGPNQEGTTAHKIVTEGLDELVHAIGVDARKALEVSVERQLHSLLTEHGLDEYVVKEGANYKAKPGVNVLHPMTQGKITGILAAWVREPAAVPLDTFGNG